MPQSSLFGTFNRGDFVRRSDRCNVPTARYSPSPQVSSADENDASEDDDWPQTDVRRDSSLVKTKLEKRLTVRPRKKRHLLTESDDEDKESSSEEELSSAEDEDKSAEDRRVSSRTKGAPKTYAENESSEEDNDVDSDDDVVIRKSSTPWPSDIYEGLFENLGNPTIEKVLDSRQAADGSIQYNVKWKGRSYSKTSWNTDNELQDIKGYRIVQNFRKLVEVRELEMNNATPEQREQMNVTLEMIRQKRANYTSAEKVLATRSVDHSHQYLTKWTDLGYDQCTWEDTQDLKSWQHLIDEFLERERIIPSARLATSKTFMFRKLLHQPPWMKNAGQLRDYQLEGLNWMLFSYSENRNVILADEMGLGKTIQCISFLGALHADVMNPGPFLVVVPLSTISAWKREFKKWTPWLNVIDYRGNRVAKQVCRDFEWFRKDKTSVVRFNVLLTNYEVANSDFSFLNNITWAYMLVDEAHRLKDDGSLLYQTLTSLKSHRRLLITGTPLQNSVKELWCLLHFLDPVAFKSLSDFQSQFGEIAESSSVRHIARLHEILKPYLLRRTKNDVLKSLPSKTERILRVDMSNLQKRYYRWVLTKNFHELNRGLKGNNASTLSNTIMELKKCSNHPYLFDNAEAPQQTQLQECARLVANSGKMVLLDRLLDRLLETGHRVLIFSQMVRMLDILADYMVLKGFKFQRLDGGMKSEDRQHAMDHFNAEGSTDFAFLLSTRAGGLGVNLATADTVIIFDSDWNPQNDLQAEARAHRIGQTKTVNIYRFVTRGTVEEDILERAKRKMILDHLVIQKMDTSGRSALDGNRQAQGSKSGNPFDKKELLRIVQFGAKQLFEEDNTSSGSSLVDDECSQDLVFDLDEILSRAEVNTGESSVDQTDQFLTAFKVANFISKPEQSTAASAVPSASWEDIVPSHLRPAIHTENEELVYPRRAKFLAHYTDNEIGTRSDRVELPAVKPTSRKRKIRGVKSDPQRDAKSAYKSIMTYGSAKAAIAAMFTAKGATISRQTADLLVHGLLHALQANSAASFEWHGCEIDAAAARARITDMALIAKAVSAVENPFIQFRITASITSVRWKTDLTWGVKQDSMLLLGTHLHGYNSWSSILSDQRLNLDIAVVYKGIRSVSNVNLSSRLKSLVKSLGTSLINRPSNIMRPSSLVDLSRSLKDRILPIQPKWPRPNSVPISSGVSPKKEPLEQNLNDSKTNEWCISQLTKQKQILKALKKLKIMDQSDRGISSDVKAAIRYIFRVGDFITQTGNDDRCPHSSPAIVESHLWSLAAPFVKATAESLATLYWDLAADGSDTSSEHLTAFLNARLA